MNREWPDFLLEATTTDRWAIGNMLGEKAMGEIKHERTGSDLSMKEWRDVLAEEAGEVLEAIGIYRVCGPDHPVKPDGGKARAHLQQELFQLGSVCILIATQTIEQEEPHA